MVKLKVIDFLEMSNKPEKFKYKNYIWEKKIGIRIYFNKEGIDFETYLASVQICDLGRAFKEVLNDEVEIIEDKPKKIEKMAISNYKETMSQYQLDVISHINRIIDNLDYLLEKSDK